MYHNENSPIFLTPNRYPFPKNHTFNKIFNRTEVKVRYSCMQNIKAIISNTFHQNDDQR